MLFAERKRKQRLTGKIGHDDGEYEIDRHCNVGILPLGKGHNTPRAANKTPSSDPAYQYRHQHLHHGESPQRQHDMLVAQPNPNFNMRQDGRNNIVMDDYYNGCVAARPNPLPLIDPPHYAAPRLLSPAVINRTPIRFRPVLNVCPPAHQALNTPLYAADYHRSPRLVGDGNPVVSNNLPSLRLPSSSAPPQGAEMPFVPVVNSGRRSRSRSDPYRPRSAAVGPLPTLSVSDDPAEEKRLARMRAIELQQENVRLFEERKRQQKIERQQQMEEDRRQEELARAERARIGRMERAEMERERQEIAGKVGKGRGAGRSNWTSDEQLRNDLLQQIKEKKERKEEERRAELEEQREMEGLANATCNKFYGGANVDDSRGTREQSPEPLDHTAPCAEPLSNSDGLNRTPVKDSNVSAVNFFQPSLPTHALAAEPFAPPKPFAPFRLDPVLPIKRPGEIGGIPFISPMGAIGTDVMPSHLPPLPPVDVVLSGDSAPTPATAQLETNLRDMITEHESITRMLKSEIKTKSVDIPLYRPRALSHTKVASPFSAGSKLQFTSFAAPPPRGGTSFRGAGELGFGAPSVATHDHASEDLSAEPSTFVGAQPSNKAANKSNG
uniref:Uncharacterized protein TCIL3000_10_920 n=1 Tax=Trypanosoma congolense (strain IL3000) TaxID=1068625 RepID=G0UVB8_TRYCI|nr:unnamed protein product [Trypanosoma congolense IL3000]